VKVKQQQIELAGAELGDRLLAVAGQRELVLAFADALGEHLEVQLAVFRNQNPHPVYPKMGVGSSLAASGKRQGSFG
jgi:hypothetical protein